MGYHQSKETCVNQADVVSDIVLLFCGSVWGRIQKRENGHFLASGVLSWRKLSPGTCPDAGHFSFSPYATGALPVTVPVLDPRESESV